MTKKPERVEPADGLANLIRTPRVPVMAKVRPRSVIASRAGPAVFKNAHGPVVTASTTLLGGVETR